MNRRTRASLYRYLTKSLGSPMSMSDKRREMIITDLVRWVMQDKHPRVRNRHGTRYVSGARSTYKTGPTALFTKHAELAVIGLRENWHWSINRIVRIPNKKILGSDQYMSRFGLDYPKTNNWDWHRKETGKRITIFVPVNYHLTVRKHGITHDGKKIVQRVWNHRVYSDKETWECSYWDFSKLTREESSWVHAKWHTGFVVKMPTSMAVEPTLSRAQSMAKSRVVRSGIKSILDDVDAV